MEIKEQKVFICPYSNKPFKTKKGAEDSAKKFELAKKELELNKIQAEKQKEQLETECNFIRLNAKSIKDFKPLIEQKAKEFWGWDVKINFNLNFGNISNSHGAPIGETMNWERDKTKPLSFLGWSGQVTGSLSKFIRTNYDPSINDTLFNQYGKGFKGFHTSSGCPGTVNDKGCNMDIGFYCFLDDFPLIKAKYEIYSADKLKLAKHKLDVERRDLDSTGWAENRSEIIELDNQIEELNKKRNILYSHFQSEYVEKNKIDSPVISDNFNELKLDFKGYYDY